MNAANNAWLSAPMFLQQEYTLEDSRAQMIICPGEVFFLLLVPISAKSDIAKYYIPNVGTFSGIIDYPITSKRQNTTAHCIVDFNQNSSVRSNERKALRSILHGLTNSLQTYLRVTQETK